MVFAAIALGGSEVIYQAAPSDFWRVLCLALWWSAVAISVLDLSIEEQLP